MDDQKNRFGSSVGPFIMLTARAGHLGDLELGRAMLDHTILSSVAEQMMSGREVDVGGRKSRVSRTGSKRLRTVRFLMGGKEYQAIEQNDEKPSRWGKLARDGRRVVQVRDLTSQKYVAAVVDGKVTEYSR